MFNRRPNDGGTFQHAQRAGMTYVAILKSGRKACSNAHGQLTEAHAKNTIYVSGWHQGTESDLSSPMHTTTRHVMHTPFAIPCLVACAGACLPVLWGAPLRSFPS
eukprot:25001-Eustigmatos_ZCMA.PRE.1